MVQVLTTGIGSVAEILISTVSTVFSGIVTALLSIIFSIYLLSGKETLGRQMRKFSKRYVSAKWCDKLNYLVSTANDCFHKYIVGQCIEAVILGGLTTIGMLLLGLPYATMIGALTCFTALIPVASGYISALVGAFLPSFHVLSSLWISPEVSLRGRWRLTWISCGWKQQCRRRKRS